jgi:hypothetical protein
MSSLADSGDAHISYIAEPNSAGRRSVQAPPATAGGSLTWAWLYRCAIAVAVNCEAPAVRLSRATFTHSLPASPPPAPPPTPPLGAAADQGPAGLASQRHPMAHQRSLGSGAGRRARNPAAIFEGGAREPREPRPWSKAKSALVNRECQRFPSRAS